MSFQSKNQKYSLRLEVNFGSGWEDYTNYLTDISIIQDTFSDSIIGLFTTEIEVRLFGLPINNKWLILNTPVRGFITSNGTEKPLFNGLTTGSTSSSPEEITLVLSNEPEKNLHREFGNDTTDLADYIYNTSSVSLDRVDMSPDGSFLPSGVYLDAFGNPSSLATANWRAGFGLQPLNQSIRCNALINKNNDNEPGIYTVDQMLKAIGLLGGYGADGSGFEVKQGYHYSGLSYPRPTFDLRDVQIFNSFKSVDSNNEYTFNTFEFEGFQFGYRRRGKNPLLDIVNAIKVLPSSQIEIESANNPNSFLEIEDKILCGIKEGYIRTVATTDGNDGSPGQNVHLTERANDYTYDFNSRGSFFNTFNFLNFGTYFQRFAGTPQVGFIISFRIRPVDDGRSQHFPIVIRDSGGDIIQVSLNRTNRSVSFFYFSSSSGSYGYHSSSNFFDWNEWQTIDVSVGDSTIGGAVSFSKNGQFVSSSFINLSIIEDKSAYMAPPNIRGRMGNLIIYDLRPTLINTNRTFDFNTNIKLGSNRGSSSSPYPGVVAYFPMNDNDYTSSSTFAKFTDPINNVTMGVSNGTWTTSLLDEKLRKYNDSNLNVLSNYSNNNFKQTLTYTPYNLDGGEAVIEEFHLYPQSSYKLLKNFTVRKSNIGANGAELKKTSQSFYLNSINTGSNNAESLAQGIVDLFSNELGVFEFSVFVQPDLDVGNIITFDIYENGSVQSSVGVVLKKRTQITKFSLIDILTVKKIRNS